MKSCIVEDNKPNISQRDFADISLLINKISNKSLGTLAKEGVFVFPKTIEQSDDLDNDLYVIKKINGYYNTTNVMGFLGFEDQQIIIRSRFSNCVGNDRYKDYFFLYVFRTVLDLPNVINLNTIADYKSSLFNFLIFLFPFYLKRALRKGAFKEYKNVSYNDYSVKGIIDIQKHIVTNNPFIGKISCKRREFSFDNDLMQLIRHTIEFIARTKFSDKILYDVKNEIKIIKELTLSYSQSERKKLIVKNRLNHIKHLYFQEYTDLQQLCLMILEYKHHGIGFGNKSIYGILFDGSWFWEEYINRLIKDNFYHPMNRNNVGRQWLFDKGNSQREGLIYPDFIGNNISCRVVGDAKYKPLSNIRRLDYFQLLSYMLRFDAKTGFFFYPDSSSELDSEIYRLNQGVSYFENTFKTREDIRIIKVGFKVPNNNDNYELFCFEMKRSEEIFIFKLRAFFCTDR